jgi:hypothetical protein
VGVTPGPLPVSGRSRTRPRLLRLAASVILGLIVGAGVFKALRPDVDYVQPWSDGYSQPDFAIIVAILVGIGAAAAPFTVAWWFVRKRERQRSDLWLALHQHRLPELLLQAHQASNAALQDTMGRLIDNVGQELFLREVESVPDARLVVPLSDALSLGPRYRSLARTALRMLVPGLDEQALPWIHQSSLYFFLRSPEEWEKGDAELALNVLNMVLRTGDSQAISHVQHLASKENVSLNVQEAAMDCIAGIQGRGHLLRAAYSPEKEADLLLRAAAQAGSEDPALLLRPQLPE